MTLLAPRPTPDVHGSMLLPPLVPRIDPITHLPILILAPHSRCNCRCVMCDIWRSTTRDEMALEAVAEWLREWRAFGVERVVLTGGEAMMHSRIWPLCDMLRDAGIAITILSTGLLLRHHAGDIVRRCDDLVISIDGPQQVHDEIRNIPRAYERIRAGITGVRAAMRDTGAGMLVSGRCTVQRANFRFMRETVAAAHDLQLDRISFLAADVSSEAFNRPGGWDAERAGEVALGVGDLDALRAELDALEIENADDFASGFIAETPLKLRRRLEQYYHALHGRADFHPIDCNAPWVSAVVETDGTVRPCFFQPALGNLKESGSLDAIINSPAAIAWRAGLDTQRDAICRKCVCSLSLRQPHADGAAHIPVAVPAQG